MTSYLCRIKLTRKQNPMNSTKFRKLWFILLQNIYLSRVVLLEDDEEEEDS